MQEFASNHIRLELSANVLAMATNCPRMLLRGQRAVLLFLALAPFMPFFRRRSETVMALITVLNLLSTAP